MNLSDIKVTPSAHAASAPAAQTATARMFFMRTV